MNQYDLEHKLQNGSVLYLGDIPTYKVTLKEMADFGFTRMQAAVSILCMEDERVKETLPDTIENPSAFLLIYLNLLQETKALEEGKLNQEALENSVFQAIPAYLSLFFRKPVIFHRDYGFLIGEKDEGPVYTLGDSNYGDFRRIVKQRNCLADLDARSEDENPSGETARKLLEKRRRLREKLKKAKRAAGEDDEGLNMADLISIFAQAEHMPLQDVYANYDVYQFNNQFNRLRIMDDFHVNIQALLAGAKSEDVKLVHWLTKIKSNSDESI